MPGVKPFSVISWITSDCHGCLDLCDYDVSFKSSFLKFHLLYVQLCKSSACASGQHPRGGGFEQGLWKAEPVTAR